MDRNDAKNALATAKLFRLFFLFDAHEQSTLWAITLTLTFWANNENSLNAKPENIYFKRKAKKDLLLFVCFSFGFSYLAYEL